MTQPCAVHTCSVPATSATWSSCTRVRCQTSQAIEFAPPSDPVGQRRLVEALDGAVHVRRHPVEEVAQ